MAEQSIRDFIPKAELSLILSGLQALHRERTQAWNLACDIAAQSEQPQPEQAAFGIPEINEALRCWGVAPLKF